MGNPVQVAAAADLNGGADGLIDTAWGEVTLAGNFRIEQFGGHLQCAGILMYQQRGIDQAGVSLITSRQAQAAQFALKLPVNHSGRRSCAAASFVLI